MPRRHTAVSIEADAFHINGQPTYAGREWNGHKIEGLLMNSRMVQAVFDDLNPETRNRWDYPDGSWNADRNTDAFIAAMPVWREHGLIGIAFNLQGGSPEAYSSSQPWHNSTFRADGSLRPDYMARLTRVLDRADELGMVVILGLFYFGQDERLTDEAAVIAATDNACNWLCENGYTNVIIEIANEVNVPKYEHEILCPPRVHELIERVQQRTEGKLLAGTSMAGNSIPPGNIIAASDFLLLHGNGVGAKCTERGKGNPDRIREMVDTCRANSAYRGQPILFNEDDHFDFDDADNNMIGAVSRYAGWGLFDWRWPDEDFDHGYQSMPCNWQISSPRKKGFFDLLKEIMGG